MPRNKIILLVIAGIVTLALTVGASAYVTQRMMQEPPAKEAKAPKADKITWNEPRQQPQPQKAAARKCDDGNVVGAIVGGVGGGVAGNQIGKGNGNVAATIGGTLGGAYLGKEFIPTHNVTCAE